MNTHMFSAQFYLVLPTSGRCPYLNLLENMLIQDQYHAHVCAADIELEPGGD